MKGGVAMYNIKFIYRPIAVGEGKEAAADETSVKCECTSIGELRELGESVNEMIEHILTNIPNDGKIAFASEACRYMIQNIDIK